MNEAPVRLLVVLGLMALIAFLSVIPGRAEEGDSVFTWAIAATPELLQKIGHLVLYGLLAMLWMRVLENTAPMARILLSLLITVGFGAVLEWAQTSIPGRFGTAIDVVLNAGGAILGILAAVLLT